MVENSYHEDFEIIPNVFGYPNYRQAIMYVTGCKFGGGKRKTQSTCESDLLTFLLSSKLGNTSPYIDPQIYRKDNVWTMLEASYMYSLGS